MSDISPQNATKLDHSSIGEQRRIWLANYLETFNKTGAARAAGYKDPENSGRDAYLALKPYIEEALQDQMVTPAEVAYRLAAAATFDPVSYIDEDGILDVKKISADGLGWMISEMSSKTVRDIDGNPETIHVVKFHSQLKSLEVLGRYLGLEKGSITNVIVVNKGYEVISPDDWDELEVIE